MIYNIIGSGSKGNATLIKSKEGLILIDMGLTLTRLNEGLEEIGANINDIDACFFTHEHSDHIKGIRFLKNRRMYALEGTLPGNYNVIELFQEIAIKDMIITPVPTSHDAFNPCAYIVKCGEEKLVYITDTGYVPEATLKASHDPDYLILESNHDVEMLMKSNRSKELKQRIYGDYGHLNNSDSAIYAKDIIGLKTKEVVLAHLSEECNKPDLALAEYQKVFTFYHSDALRRVSLRCAMQNESLIGGTNED